MSFPHWRKWNRHTVNATYNVDMERHMNERLKKKKHVKWCEGGNRTEPKFNNVYQFGSLSAWIRSGQELHARDINATIGRSNERMNNKKKQICMKEWKSLVRSMCVVCCVAYVFAVYFLTTRFRSHFIACVVALWATECHRHYVNKWFRVIMYERRREKCGTLYVCFVCLTAHVKNVGRRPVRRQLRIRSVIMSVRV